MKIYLKYPIVLFYLIVSLSMKGQDAYLLYLQDRDISKCRLALSADAFSRKSKLKIPIDSRDYTIDSRFIRRIEQIVPIYSAVNWLHAVVVFATKDQINEIQKWNIVRKIEFLGTSTTKKMAWDKMQETYTLAEYGSSFPQIGIHHGNTLHDAGFQGQGMKIAILDGGFLNADSILSLRHLFLKHRVHPIKNLVQNNDSLFVNDGHGTYVLGAMASFIKDTIIASAPEASYYLFITENNQAENKLEEVNWAIGAQMADSIGVDILNSSLGYTEFDDPSTNYKPSQMDGHTTIVAQAAQIACQKGLVVVNAAGNMARKPWHTIVSPGDVDKVITVGAIDAYGSTADFSSIGWNAHNIIKPNIVSVGKKTLTYFNHGNLSYANGTSFATPLMAGLIACLWQRYPHLSTDSLRDLIYRSSDQYFASTVTRGFGIPNFQIACNIIDSNQFVLKKPLMIYPNPSSSDVIVEFESNVAAMPMMYIFYENKMVASQKIEINRGKNQVFVNTQILPSSGVHFFHMTIGDQEIMGKFLKN